MTVFGPALTWDVCECGEPYVAQYRHHESFRCPDCEAAAEDAFEQARGDFD